MATSFPLKTLMAADGCCGHLLELEGRSVSVLKSVSQGELSTGRIHYASLAVTR